MKKTNGFLTDAQLRTELFRCEYCEEKPCKQACPADCSPADFIMAARVGGESDFRRSAALIMASNPLGGVCGVVCPDYFCMKACSRRTFDRPINIPAVQAAVVARGKKAELPSFTKTKQNGKRVAIIGAGPAGLGAASVLGQKGYQVVIFEKGIKAGGMANLIPDARLDKNVLRTDIRFLKNLGDITFHWNTVVKDPASLLRKKFDAVIVSAGLDVPILLNIPGEEYAISWQDFLEKKETFNLKNKKVAVIGGGAVAADCATAAAHEGAAMVELMYRRKMEHMPLTSFERSMLLDAGVEISSRTRVIEIVRKGKRVIGIRTVNMILPKGKSPEPRNFVVNRKEKTSFREFDIVVTAVGSTSTLPSQRKSGIFYAGDLILGSSTVVEAVATGKNAALQAEAFMCGKPKPKIQSAAKSYEILPGMNLLPIPVHAQFFGRTIRSPFLISAAPHTDGYDQMKRAYEHGWAGGVMKTSFDNVPIHIPAEYMFVLGNSTYGNADNVSGHPLDRVCKEIEQLIKEFPDRLTLASTGGPVTGNDDNDKRVWQSNTRKLEHAGAMGVEYSLSCPQGGDGAKGDVVSQDAELTARIIDWVMDISTPDIPKLFKLTAAVTAIRPIMQSIQRIFAKYPDKKAGVTLANSFPTMAFRKAANRRWEEGVVIGLSGEGVLPISNLTLAKVAGMGFAVSGNGGPMDYKGAANFLALGAQTVQFCTIVMKYGYGIIDELNSGLSYMMQERGFTSVSELIGSALPNPITEFSQLTALKTLPTVDRSMCQHCGNCTRCPYQAIALDKKKIPTFDPAYCIGCSLCAQKCFAGAITMRSRTAQELVLFHES